MLWIDHKLITRFNAKFKINSNTECWEWTACKHTRGYGNFYVGEPLSKRKMESAHRVSFMIHNLKPLSELEEICHKCDNPKCVNPEHLFEGTHKENMEDMVRKNRCTSGKYRLTEDQVLGILNHPKNTKETAEDFEIDSGYCSRLRNFKVKCWQYLENDIRVIYK